MLSTVETLFFRSLHPYSEARRTLARWFGENFGPVKHEPLHDMNNTAPMYKRLVGRCKLTLGLKAPPPGFQILIVKRITVLSNCNPVVCFLMRDLR